MQKTLYILNRTNRKYSTSRYTDKILQNTHSHDDTGNAASEQIDRPTTVRRKVRSQKLSPKCEADPSTTIPSDAGFKE